MRNIDNKSDTTTPTEDSTPPGLVLPPEELRECRGLHSVEEENLIREAIAKNKTEAFDFFIVAASLATYGEDIETRRIILRILQQLARLKKIPRPDYVGLVEGRVLTAYAHRVGEFEPVQVLTYRKRLAERISAEIDTFAADIAAGKTTLDPILN